MIAAVIDSVEELGYARMTVAQVIERARVSRRTFYDQFADREDCFLVAFEQALQRVRVTIRDRCAGQPDWRDGARAGLAALLELIDTQPGCARMCVVEALAGDARILAKRAAALDELTRAMHAAATHGSAGAGGAAPPTLLGAEAVVGGALAVLHSRLVLADPRPYTTLLGPLMSMIVLPYLGADAAAQELSIGRRYRPSVRRQPPPERVADPLAGLQMRVTHRTMLVLAKIAEHPGASNREIAQVAGIVDQGQISKLLRRLVRLGLVENRGLGHDSGAPNEWHLTARGAQLARTGAH